MEGNSPHPFRCGPTPSSKGEGFYSCAFVEIRKYTAALMQSTEAFPSEGKVANVMSRMRCSRRSGVTFIWL